MALCFGDLSTLNERLADKETVVVEFLSDEKNGTAADSFVLTVCLTER